MTLQLVLWETYRHRHLRKACETLQELQPEGQQLQQGLQSTNSQGQTPQSMSLSILAVKMVKEKDQALFSYLCVESQTLRTE